MRAAATRLLHNDDYKLVYAAIAAEMDREMAHALNAIDTNETFKSLGRASAFTYVLRTMRGDTHAEAASTIASPKG